MPTSDRLAAGRPTMLQYEYTLRCRGIHPALWGTVRTVECTVEGRQDRQQQKQLK
jgi:hypothetical protein